MNSRVKLENLALKKGIKQSHEETTESFIELILKNDSLNRKELIIIAKSLNIKKSHKLSINSLINLLRDFLIKKELNDLGLNKLSERYVSINELDRIRKLNELSHKVLKELGKLQQIRNYDSQSKEYLVYGLLRSKNPNEDNCISRITVNYDISTLDNEIKEQIDDIKRLVVRLGNLLTNKEITKITKKLHDTLEKIKNTNRNTKLRKRQKENISINLIEHHNSLAKKEKCMDLNYEDLQYHGLSDIKNTLDIINIDSYYEPELIASAFHKHYERYRINGDNNKELSLNAYLDTVRQNVVELITKKNIGETKAQLVLLVLFINYLNNEKAEKYICSDNIVIRTTDDSNIITTCFYKSLIKKYQETLENKMEGSSL